MFLYNWHTIYNASQGDAEMCFKIVKMLVNKDIPENKYDPIYPYVNINFVGSSFMLHPDVLIFNSYKYTYRDLAAYIGLASMRPLATYFNSGKLTLDLLQSPVDPMIYLNNQSLLPVKNGNIHFLYEEVPIKKELH